MSVAPAMIDGSGMNPIPPFNPHGTPPSADLDSTERLAVVTTEDQPLGMILDTMRLGRTSPTTFAGRSLPQFSGRIYGGQALAQAIVAAEDTVPDDGDGLRQLHSVHGYFLRPGKADKDVQLAVEELHDGRSFSTRRTHVFQDHKPILSLINSYQESQPGVEHASQAPQSPDPESLPSAIELFDSHDHPVAKFMSSTAAFDIRHVGSNLYVQPDPQARPNQQLWMRARSPIPPGMTQLQHRALLAYGSDQVLLEPALRRHGLCWRTEGLSVASLDHSMWWHRDVNVGQWLLFDQYSPSAQGGRALASAKVFSTDGTHVATIQQEGMIRIPKVTK